MSRTEEARRSQTVQRALDVLECIAAADQPISISEVARRCSLTRPTAHRLVATLEERGYVSVAASQRYRLGTRVLALGANALQGMRLQDTVRPALQRIHELCDETIHLAVRQGHEVVYIDKVESTQAVRMHSVVGARGPLHSTSLGKAIWAFLPDQERTALIEVVELERRTAQTITDRGALRDHLNEVRKQGFVLDDVENEEGIRCVGAPILDAGGYPIAAVSISGPAFRLSREKVLELAPKLVAEAQRASAEFGFEP